MSGKNIIEDKSHVIFNEEYSGNFLDISYGE